MELDIDIEEHDVLDNPLLKTIFPDISVIKKEIHGYLDAGKLIILFFSYTLHYLQYFKH